MKRSRGVGPLLPALFALAAAAGCGEEKKPEDKYQDATRYDVGTATDATVGDGGGDDGGGGAGGGGGAVHTRISMLKEVKPDNGSAGSLDLVIYDLDDKREANLTQSAGGQVDCRTRGCLLNRQMTWIGWITRGAAGNELWVAPIDTVHFEVDIDAKRKVSDDVQSFEFTNDGRRDLVVYVKGEALGPEGQLEVWVEPAAAWDQAVCDRLGEGGTGGQECDGDAACAADIEYCDAGGHCALDLTVCPQAAGAINGDGAFRVTPFGSVIILLRTDLSSMAVSFFNAATGAALGLKTFGSENGTGSQFSGRLPVALSPDATYLAVVTRDDFLWKMYNLKAVPNPPEPVRLDLFETQGDRADDCQRPAPFNFNQVRFDPRFDEAGEHIYFLAAGDCSTQMNPGGSNREDIDILRVDKSLEPSTVVSVTKNPRINSWANHQITDYDLSADATRLAFSAPRPFDNASRSIWIINPDPAQEFPEYEPGPEESCQRAEDGHERCEFLFDEVPNARVIYRGVRFHEVVVR